MKPWLSRSGAIVASEPHLYERLLECLLERLAEPDGVVELAGEDLRRLVVDRLVHADCRVEVLAGEFGLRGGVAAVEDDQPDPVEGGMQDGMDSALFKILAHHVIGERVEADAIGGEYDTLNGDTITVEGDPESGMTVTGGEVEANVLCGGIQTANATVYVIDAVMTDGDI